jgi:tetratricopeptide (TPR) repeat protein
MSTEMFNEAVQAAKTGQRKRAKDLLTRLLKTEPNNVDYWVWMSAVVETEKEQIFCLQKAAKIDPNSMAARRGLVILGAMSPEEAALPPPQPIEAASAVELPQMGGEGGIQEWLSRPRNRTIAIAVTGIVVALVLIGSITAAVLSITNKPAQVVVVTSTPTPSDTPLPTATLPAGITPTPTIEPCTVPPAPIPSTPIAAYLCLTPVPTTAYIPTEAAQFESYKSMMKGYVEADWDRVIQNFPQTARISSLQNDPFLYFFAAEAYRHKNQNPDALTNYKEALKHNPNFAAAIWGKVLIELEQKKQTDALADLDKAIAADPAFPLPYLARASYYGTTIGNYERALADLQLAQGVAPDNPLVLAHLAVGYADNNQPEQALETAQKALAFDPGLALGFYARGRAEYALGQFAAAEKDLSIAVPYILDPNNFAELYPLLDAMSFVKYYDAQVLYFFGLAKYGVEKDNEALDQFNTSIKFYDSFPPVYVARGNVYLHLQKYDLARPDFNTAIGKFQASDANNPLLDDAYLGNGLAFLGLNRPDSALSNFQVVVRDRPEDFAARMGLGQSQLGSFKLATGNVTPADALETFTAALALAAKVDQQAQAHYWLAQSYAAVNDVKSQIAELALVAAIANAPDKLNVTAVAQLTAIGPLPTDTLTPTATLPPTETPAPTATTKGGSKPTATPTAGKATATPGKATATVSKATATPSKATATVSKATATPSKATATTSKATATPAQPTSAASPTGYPAGTRAP